MKKFGIISFVSLLLIACSSSPVVTSPDGSLSVRLEQSGDGEISYSVARDEQTIISSSPLGFLTREQPLQSGFKVTGTKKETYSSEWETVWGEERVIEDRHNSLLVSLAHESGILMDIEFRVFNDGFAFRYIFPEQ
ncbi:MAG: glycoside hydrolase family 97 N-terminal domain-containing protein, partial [Paludibacteraceae bacterium]|nr:glycoside hydrolase family 97 N-terminal domain-containing protein [Paludibacteraceae bacterium]